MSSKQTDRPQITKCFRYLTNYPTGEGLMSQFIDMLLFASVITYINFFPLAF